MFFSCAFASLAIPKSPLRLDIAKRNISSTMGFPMTIVSSSSGFGHVVLTNKPISASGDINLPSRDEDKEVYDVRVATTDYEILHATGIKAHFLFANKTLWSTEEKRDLIQKIEFHEYIKTADRGRAYKLLDVGAPMKDSL